MSITETEFKNNVDAFSDAALQKPVIITSPHRGRLVLLSADEYFRLTHKEPEGVSEDFKRLLDEQAEYHRDTIMELAKR